MLTGQDVPVWEITESTVEYLYSLAVETGAREDGLEILVSDLEQKTREFAAEGEL